MAGRRHTTTQSCERGSFGRGAGKDGRGAKGMSVIKDEGGGSPSVVCSRAAVGSPRCALRLARAPKRARAKPLGQRPGPGPREQARREPGSQVGWAQETLPTSRFPATLHWEPGGASQPSRGSAGAWPLRGTFRTDTILSFVGDLCASPRAQSVTASLGGSGAAGSPRGRQRPLGHNTRISRGRNFFLPEEASAVRVFHLFSATTADRVCDYGPTLRKHRSFHRRG